MRFSNQITGILCMLASSASFVLNDSFIKLAATGLPTFQLLFIRAYVACVIGAIMITLMGQWRALPGVFEPRTILRGLAETGAAFCFTIALFQMPLANIFAISQTIPLFLILGAALFYRDHLGLLQILLIILGFGGALIVARPDFSNLSPAILFAFASVLCIATRDLIGRGVPTHIPVIVVTVATSALVGIAAGLLHFTTESWVVMQPRQLLYVTAAGIFIALGQVGVLQLRGVECRLRLLHFRGNTKRAGSVRHWSYRGDRPCFGARQPAASRLHVINLNRALDLDRHWVAEAVFGFDTGGHAHPAFGDAILLHIGFFDAVKPNADLVLQNRFAEMRAARINAQVIWQGWFGVGHRANSSNILHSI
jgi:drug/metabolite transporter (DMT)-like permease